MSDGNATVVGLIFNQENKWMPLMLAFQLPAGADEGQFVQSFRSLFGKLLQDAATKNISIEVETLVMMAVGTMQKEMAFELIMMRADHIGV